MKTFRFHFNIGYAVELRNAVVDRKKQSIDVKHADANSKSIKGEYLAWNRICAIMDRLEDTLVYLNRMELGGSDERRTAFDFFDFINNCFVVIDCIKTIGSIFRLDKGIISKIEKSSSIFGVD